MDMKCVKLNEKKKKESLKILKMYGIKTKANSDKKLSRNVL